MNAENIITLDFETYYDKLYSLSKITTEEYIRDDKFEVIGVAVKVNDEETQWFAGTHVETAEFLAKFDWQNSFALAHNMMFDGAILNWRFNIRPFAFLDTLSMARAVDGVDVGNSLATLAERYDIGVKGKEVILALGKHTRDFSGAELRNYGEYCRNDVDLTYKLFNILVDGFSKKELRLIDLTLKMFINPILRLDLPLLEQHLIDVVEHKEALITTARSDKESLMSNNKFAEALINLGVRPPTKKSPTTGKRTYAFAKNDEGMKRLAEDNDERVQALVAARLGTKSTLEETRTQRMIGIAKRGVMPVPLRYYAAHTGRWGGDDKLNLQNLPRKSKLKSAVLAPDGHVFIDADSSQIEARILAWLAGQTDLVDAFEKGEDVYKIMASKIYTKDISLITDEERFVGKTTILGAGYGMGHMKFNAQLKAFGVDVPPNICKVILSTYRDQFSMIPALWDEASLCLDALSSPTPKTCEFGKQPQATNLLPSVGFDMPNGIPLRYNDLRQSRDGTPLDSTMYMYQTRRGPVRIYGGKAVENICQALARCVIGEQMLKISKRYRVVLTVHDAIVCVAPEPEWGEAAKYVQECMRWRPKWAQTLPLNCEVKYGKNYGATSKYTG